MIKIEASPTGYGISFSEFKKAPVLSSVKDIWFSNDQGSSDNTQGSFVCILFTIFPVNLWVDRGQSIKCVIFQPQVSSNFA